jgi:hypothetical protein
LWLVTNGWKFSSWQALLDPTGFFSWFASLFGGRPKLGPDSATDNIAISLLASVNPVLRLYGAGIRALEAQGIPVSASSGAGRTLLNQLAARTASDIYWQFGPTEGPKYWRSVVGYVFNFCSAGPCQIVFQRDPTYHAWVSNGWLRAQDGAPIWRQIPINAQPGPTTSTPPPVPTTPPPPPPRVTITPYSFTCLCANGRSFTFGPVINPHAQSEAFCSAWCTAVDQQQQIQHQRDQSSCACTNSRRP